MAILLLLTNLVFITAKTNRQDEKQLEEKYGKLLEMSARENVISFNGNRFRKFARNSPRNYSLIVMFTALSTNRGCKICRQVADEFDIVGDSFDREFRNRADDQPQKQFFVSIDFDTASDVFSIMNLEQAPVMMHFPEKGKPQKSDTMDLANKGMSADAIAKFVDERTGFHIRIVRPTNKKGLGALIVIFLLFFTILYYRFDHLQFLYNSKMWGVLIVSFVVIMCSGQMYNSIRGVPVAEKTSNGVSFISGNPQYQYIAESYIVILLYGGIVIGMIRLTDVKKGTVSKRKTFATIGIALVAFFFSVTISVFRVKNNDYPFRFLFG
jgi:oligosaccharyltransferase complex subunit gamma